MLRVSDLICARQLFDCLPPACRPQDDNDNGDDDDIYIMMQCLFVCVFVTKNHNFLKRPVCLSVCLFVRFILTSLKVESRK